MSEKMRNKVLSRFNKNEDFSFERKDVQISNFEYLELLKIVQKIQNQQKNNPKEMSFEKGVLELNVKKSIELYKDGNIKDAYLLLKSYESEYLKSNIKQVQINDYKKNWYRFVLVDLALVGAFFISWSIFTNVYVNNTVQKNTISAIESIKVGETPVADINSLDSLDVMGPPLLLSPQLGDEILLNVYKQAKEANPKITESDILYVASKDYFVKALEKHNELDQKIESLGDKSKPLMLPELSKQKENLVKSMVEMVNIGASERILEHEIEDKLKNLSE